MHEYVGVIHIHSRFSDGTGDLPDIIKPAQQLGLDFLVLTDHLSVAARDAGWQGYHGSVLVLVGYEHHDQAHHNHYLILGENVQVLPKEYSAHEYVQAARKNGYLGIIAHPAEKRKVFASLPAFPWEAWEAEGFDGIEIWNLLSDWVEQITHFNFLFRLFFPRRFLNPPPRELLERWDLLTQARRISIIGGADAHASRYRCGFLQYTLVPYKVGFQSVRTHILLAQPLTGDAAMDPSFVLQALRMGQCFISNFRAGDARGFRFWLEQDGRAYMPGSELPHKSGMLLQAMLPRPAEITLVRNGKPCGIYAGSFFQHKIKEPGVYRLEVRTQKKPWIYTNPIYLR